MIASKAWIRGKNKKNPIWCNDSPIILCKNSEKIPIFAFEI